MKDKEKEEILNWLCDVVPLYRQAEEITHPIAQVDADGLPVDLESLPYIVNSLSPILSKVKKMPKPEYAKLRQMQKDFRLTLEACINSAKYRMKLEKKWSRLTFSTAVFWTNLAISFKKSLSLKMKKMIRDFDKGGLL
ncbi:MAG TPA: hypothetical protein DCR59_05075 [Dehalococcoidia bacterium]|nr:hypothetical protein [Dehalococcoidia bacterium]